MQRHLTSQLLAILQQGSELPIWDCHPELLIWFLCIGGAATGVGPTRSGYIALLHQNHANRFQTFWTSWPSLLEIFTQFIWSEKAFESVVKRFGRRFGGIWTEAEKRR
jgi:predicted oxidoreductase